MLSWGVHPLLYKSHFAKKAFNLSESGSSKNFKLITFKLLIEGNKIDDKNNHYSTEVLNTKIEPTIIDK